MDVAILIISYNTRDLALACLKSVYEQTSGIDFEVLVVDNQSADGSAGTIAAEFPQVDLIRAPKNLGFAGGNNLAAKNSRGDWLLLLNPDTVVLDGAIQRLHAFAKTHLEASIFGGRTAFSDGSLNPKSCWRRATPWSTFCFASGLSRLFRRSALFNPEAYGGWQRDTTREVDIVSGCFFLIRKRLWDELGGFDLAFFMYGEEADLCLRAKRLGHKCLICPEATIIHYGGASEKVRADKMVKLFVAKTQLFDRHWWPGTRWFGRRCFDMWAFSRMAAFGLLRWVQPRHRESFETWRAIWGRRSEWRRAAHQ